MIPVQIKEKSLDNLKHEILEISFQALSADQAVNSVIDIVLVNADKVTAVLEKLNMKIPYSALPADMIDTLENRRGRHACGNHCDRRGYSGIKE